MQENIKLTVTVNSVIDNLTDAGLPDSEPEINIFTTAGAMVVADEGIILSFTESGEGGEATSTLVITDGGVHLVKTGAIESDMLFNEGACTNTLYHVGPYAFDMSINTKRIRNSLTSEGGELQLIYSMNVGGQEKNVSLKISAKRK